MATAATLYHFTLHLADVDRGAYADFELRVACHPSETLEFMLTRVLAYCLEYQDGIELTDGVSATDEPAVVVRDLTGRLTAWIEVGAPDAERIHRGSKRAGRAAIYTHRDPGPLLAQLGQERIHRAAEIPVHALGRELVAEAARRLQRRNELSVSVSGRHLYLDVNGHAVSGAIAEHRLA